MLIGFVFVLYELSLKLWEHTSLRALMLNGVSLKVFVRAGFKQMTHDQTVLGIVFLDCSHQTSSRIALKVT